MWTIDVVFDDARFNYSECHSMKAVITALAKFHYTNPLNEFGAKVLAVSIGFE